MKTLNDLVPETVTVDELENVRAAANYYALKYMNDGAASIIDIIKAMYLDADRKLVSIKEWVSDELGISSVEREKYEHVSLCVLSDLNSIGYNILDELEAKKSSPKVNRPITMLFQGKDKSGGYFGRDGITDKSLESWYDFPRN
jgi:hypothetical protein